MISSVLGFIWYGKSEVFGELCRLITAEAENRYTAVFIELLFLLSVFIAGPTIYAPVGSFITLFIYGVLAGARASLSVGDTYTALVEVFFSSLTAYLLVVYSSFVTLTGIGIFTSQEDDGERRMFDGVMFRAKKFRGIFNFRYIASYILFFLLFLAGNSSAVLLKTVLL